MQKQHEQCSHHRPEHRAREILENKVLEGKAVLSPDQVGGSWTVMEGCVHRKVHRKESGIDHGVQRGNQKITYRNAQGHQSMGV